MHAYRRAPISRACLFERKLQGSGPVDWCKKIAFGFALSRVVLLGGGGGVACAGACCCVRVFELLRCASPDEVPEAGSGAALVVGEVSTSCWPGAVCALVADGEEGGESMQPRLAVLAGQALYM